MVWGRELGRKKDRTSQQQLRDDQKFIVGNEGGQGQKRYTKIIGDTIPSA